MPGSFDGAVALAERERRQNDVRQTVAALQATPAQGAALVQAVVQRSLDSPSSTYRNASRQWQREGCAITNFAQTLPRTQSDLARQVLKDPYVFDFLSLTPEHTERELETALIEHVTQFLLELGAGFAYLGRQVPLQVGERDFFIDLLFYHARLHCYVVVELKAGAFKPEYAGKMNFYCNVVDDRLRHATDQPTIGLVLCQKPNHVLAEYALRGVDKPIGVSGFELTRALPETLQSSLPSIEQIERELAGNGQANEDESQF